MDFQINRTTIIVKDLLFQEKYNLSHSQTDLMAYFVNVTSWAMEINNHRMIATKKIMRDMPCMGEKTIEASIKVLKDLKLITCKTLQVVVWTGKPWIRGIKLTEKGKEYNAKLMLPSKDKKVRDLEKEVNELKEIIRKLKVEKPKQIEKIKETKERVKSFIPEIPKKEKIDFFIEDITKIFGQNNKSICNGVPEWDKNTTFFINSYNKLGIITPEDNVRQLKKPSEINKFWKWISQHPKRIGYKINFDVSPNLKELKKIYMNEIIVVNGEKEKINNLIQKKRGIKIVVENSNGDIRPLLDKKTKGDLIISNKQCQDLLFELSI